jgi:hypothetical protein
VAEVSAATWFMISTIGFAVSAVLFVAAIVITCASGRRR